MYVVIPRPICGLDGPFQAWFLLSIDQPQIVSSPEPTSPVLILGLIAAVGLAMRYAPPFLFRLRENPFFRYSNIFGARLGPSLMVAFSSETWISGKSSENGGPTVFFGERRKQARSLSISEEPIWNSDFLRCRRRVFAISLRRKSVFPRVIH